MSQGVRVLTRGIVLAVFLAAALCLICILPWLIAKPPTDQVQRGLGWALGLAALVGYPIAIAALILTFGWVSKGAKLQSRAITPGERTRSRAVGIALFAAFAVAMIAAVALRFG